MSEDRTVSPRTTGRNANTALATTRNVDIGALVGIRINEEFSAGGRTGKISCNAWVCYRPTLNRDEIASAS
jgi:hypothetical protein